MKEILFRGKRINNCVQDSSIDYRENGVGEWVYGDLIHRQYYKNKDVIVIRTEDNGFDNYSDYEVEPSSIGIFTGLYDKNGKKVFEGDILSIEHNIGDVKILKYAGVVKYEENKGAFVCDGTTRCDCLYAFDSSEYEVVGNTSDGPKLPKGE